MILGAKPQKRIAHKIKSINKEFFRYASNLSNRGQLIKNKQCASNYDSKRFSILATARRVSSFTHSNNVESMGSATCGSFAVFFVGEHFCYEGVYAPAERVLKFGS